MTANDVTADDDQTKPTRDGDRLAGTPQSDRRATDVDRLDVDRRPALDLPRPVVRRRHWSHLLVWLVPVAAVVIAGFYARRWLSDRGPLVTIRVMDAAQLIAGETPVRSKGVEIGLVRDVTLADDLAGALVRVQLRRPAEKFARDGASFWLVKPDFSGGSISGLGTVLSGPYFEAAAGSGEAKTDFVAAPEAPNAPIDGLPIRLIAPRVKNVERGTPINFRGCAVGVVDGVRLAEDGTHVIVRAIVQSRYAPLVRTDSQFWVEAPADLKGGIFSGLQVKVGSLRQILSGGVSFASPGAASPTSPQAANDATFVLRDEPGKDALTWDPTIPIVPVDPAHGAKQPSIRVK